MFFFLQKKMCNSFTKVIIYSCLAVFLMQCAPQTSSLKLSNFNESEEYLALLNYRCNNRSNERATLINPNRELLEEFDEVDANNYFSELDSLKKYYNSLPINDKSVRLSDLEPKFLSERSINFRNALRATYSGGYVDPRIHSELMQNLRKSYPNISLSIVHDQLEADLKKCS